MLEEVLLMIYVKSMLHIRQSQFLKILQTTLTVQINQYTAKVNYKIFLIPFLFITLFLHETSDKTDAFAHP